jgi:hypothetical protein
VARPPQVPRTRLAVVCVVAAVLLLLLLLQALFAALKHYTPAAYMPVFNELAQELVVLGSTSALLFALNLSSVPRDVSRYCFGIPHRPPPVDAVKPVGSRTCVQTSCR